MVYVQTYYKVFSSKNGKESTYFMRCAMVGVFVQQARPEFGPKDLVDRGSTTWAHVHKLWICLEIAHIPAVR
jgi:hypothetical protein